MAEEVVLMKGNEADTSVILLLPNRKCWKHLLN